MQTTFLLTYWLASFSCNQERVLVVGWDSIQTAHSYFVISQFFFSEVYIFARFLGLYPNLECGPLSLECSSVLFCYAA